MTVEAQPESPSPLSPEAQPPERVLDHRARLRRALRPRPAPELHRQPAGVHQRHADRASRRVACSRIVALGYTLVYGILQLINFAHGDVFALSGLVSSTIMIDLLNLSGDEAALGVIVGLVATLVLTAALCGEPERLDRVPRLPASPKPAAADDADQRGRHVVHRPEHRALLLRRRLLQRSSGLIPTSLGLHDRRGLAARGTRWSSS